MAKQRYGPKKMIERLTEVRRKLEMHEGAFVATWTPDTKLPKCRDDVTPFIRQQTRLWRETWILPVLDGVIEALENKR